MDFRVLGLRALGIEGPPNGPTPNPRILQLNPNPDSFNFQKALLGLGVSERVWRETSQCFESEGVDAPRRTPDPKPSSRCSKPKTLRY